MTKHSCCGGLCIMPPSPDLQEKIVQMKAALISEAGLSGIDDLDIMDLRTYSLIAGRPRQTRSNEFVASVAEHAPPVTGTRKAIVLLVDFSDKTATRAQSQFNNLLFSVGTYATGSMRDFYREASYNQLDVQGEVAGTGPTAGWFRAPRTKAYYTANNFGFGSYPTNAQKLTEDVIDLANPHVNFAQYDNDGDGFVEALVIICAGSGGEQTGNKSDIWSHKWNITPKNVDGVKIDRYFMAPEDGRVGVMAHELGHLLCGLPDLYDTDYTSRGTGKWDLMAGGSWNGSPQGDKPAHPTAWCKYKSGWVNPTVIFNQELDVTIRPYKDFKDVFKLPIGAIDSKEYFLISNRRQTGFDSAIPGEGLLIEHIDDNKTNNTDENHYLVDIEQADGLRQLNTNANSGDANDLFPTASNNQFSVSSSPNSKAYSGTDSKVTITNITRSGSNITAKINVGGGTALGTLNNKKVLQVYATPHSQNAWAFIESAGWRKMEPLSVPGVTAMFEAMVHARSSGKTITAQADASKVNLIYY